MKDVSSRIAALETDSSLQVIKEVNSLIAQGRKIKNFCSGEPDFFTPKHICDAAKNAIESGKHGYTPCEGLSELRKNVASYFSATRGIDYLPEDIIIGCGSRSFIWHSIFATTDPKKKHEVIIPNPAIPTYRAMVLGLGALPVSVNLRESDNYILRPKDLADKITPKTRLLILNSPHNPTGSVIPNEHLNEIAHLCIKNDLWVYSDEAYSRLVFDSPFRSIASIPGMKERTIVVDCVSQTYAMTGWRIGYMANSILAPYISRLNANSIYCAPYPSQIAAAAALKGPQAQIQEMIRTFKERRHVLVDGLNKIPGIECKLPGGAFYAWANVTKACHMTGCADSEKLRKRLLDEANIACLSDIHFGHKIPKGGEHLRFTFTLSSEDLHEGLRRISDFINLNSVNQ